MAISMTACGTSDYSGYSSAYNKMAEPGSMDADFTVSIDTDEKSIEGTGNMKLDINKQTMYFEMTVGDTTVREYLQDGKLYTDVDGQQSTLDTASKQQDNERPKTEGGSESKDNGDTFELDSFLEEMATMVEATKIKEMGLLDPIPSSVISEITTSDDANGKTYTLVLSDSLVKKLFNTMIGEQISNDDYSLTFEEIKNFNCSMHENKDGILDGMVYGGSTTVTVPAALTGGDEETFEMDITINVDINNPGSAVEVPAYNGSAA